MNTKAAVVEIPAAAARNWVTESLGGGHFISEAVLASSRLDRGSFRAILPAEIRSDQIPDFERGGVIDRALSEAALAQDLDGLAQRGGACVVVEDDLGLRTDPATEQASEPLAFVGDRVVSWCDLGAGAGSAATEIVAGVGSGYPTNAFVVSRSAADLGLADRRSMPADFGQEIAQGLLAVVVAAFDDESYVIWTES